MGRFGKTQKSIICPIHKGGENNLPQNYRSIALISCISKIFEKAYVIQLSRFLTNNKILNENQFGFRKEHSTLHALMSRIENIADAFENHEFLMAIYIDLTKAYDTIDTSILVKKLKHYGIQNEPLNWVKSYLMKRTQVVKIQGTISDEKDVTCGLPQGSLIAPLLFIIYINDLPHISENLNKILFADDTNLFKRDKSLTRLNKEVENQLIDLETWLKVNKLSLNVSKTKSMVFRTRKNRIDIDSNINMCGQKLDKVEKTKFLGVYIDKHLDWNEHINHVTNKLSRINAIIYNSRDYLTLNARIQLYNSFVLPHLSYCIAVWGDTSQYILKPLIILQKRIVRTIHYAQIRGHTSP